SLSWVVISNGISWFSNDVLNNQSLSPGWGSSTPLFSLPLSLPVAPSSLSPSLTPSLSLTHSLYLSGGRLSLACLFSSAGLYTQTPQIHLAFRDTEIKAIVVS